MKLDEYRICANCKHFASSDRYHGTCRLRSEIRTVRGIEDMMQKRVRWNDDARSCSDFDGSLG